MGSSRGATVYALVAALAFATILLFGLSVWLWLSAREPGDRSAEAGFARDMIVHHAQAVEMAGIARDRTENERIETLATDIVLTQQAQIGQMQGWLEIWDLPAAGPEPPMAWMGHPTEGRMPGMASPGDINQLRELPPQQADQLFLELMIEHHQAAVPMAEAALDATGQPVVERLADSIIASQQSEIELMEGLLQEMGGQPGEAEPAPAHDEHEGHDHGAGSG